ncbi:MAG: hypothetical protein A2148_11680 [Chloroflexi bacterium RBG_16_68_14]|nr:MAG: hypothetical protein A2148_11680 [Chloroflexi bacterium RBG_16_68_14]
MARNRFRLREGSSKDLPALTRIDGSFGNEWLLYLQRRGGPIEQTIELRWRKVRPAGSRRSFEVDVATLRSDLRRSERLIVAEADRRVVGYLMLGTNWNRTAELVAIIVDAAYRRRGLGRRFVQEAEAYARGRSLRALQWEAQTDNRDAIEFAVSQGFRIVAVHDALYHNRGDQRQLAPDFRGLAVFLTKELD